ncbi:hypothetical protein TRIATDRAFT_322971 [Trichoderma atroviride IMI 206040]|uniref:NACHT domain-containing protein n=1 Tax=Hypocrea atroviridis (strain ATCC 20476 / IMI 206040) TaxID=452589 RepID=G9PC17_HYPAI|nr:uncharacterized protein TRIATDRAFT_322971 [Trichoderma atroviride IMI 206040]EHK39399.1 hypothetical protein TRIATDRAFT_322971 [Trichoderma atroviride IMI 206040]
MPEGKCKDCQKAKDVEKEEFQRNEKDFEKIKSKLEPLRRNIMDAILLSLWDDSKRTEQWEVHFSSQLDKLIELLGSTENLSMNNSLRTALTNQRRLTQNGNDDVESPKGYIPEHGTTVSTKVDGEAARLRIALQPVIQPGEGPTSLVQLAKHMVQYFKTDGEAKNEIRAELVKVLWKNDWKLDNAMASAKIDTTITAHAIATGIQFSNIETREEAISKSFQATYSWIFQDEPLKKDGAPMWHSFPSWLQDESEKPYWITGKPGSGKSTIMKLILQQQSVRDSLSRSLGSMHLVLVKYYAWLAGTTLQKSIDGLKRTILFQALKQYPGLAPVLAPRRWAFCQVLQSISGLPVWDSREIEESFEALLSSCGKSIKLALFIDGLDEFKMPPVEIVEFIQRMIARCPKGLKLCAASRPWPEFHDTFNEGPMLQMHFLTKTDMEIFVQENLKINKGFVERKQLEPEASSQLLADIVERANGVFLWVSLVMQHLSSLFSDGQSISQARKALEALPTDISSLYDGIWTAIRPENLIDASHMIQVLRAYDGPMEWLTFWAIEESKSDQFNADRFPKSGKLKEVALKSIARKLAACTKCILEVSGNATSGVVDFIHRTARDWAVKPETWKRICSSSGAQFDPHLCILKAKIMMLPPVASSSPDDMGLWGAMTRILWHAGEVNDNLENTPDLVNSLHLLDPYFKHLSRVYERNITTGPYGWWWQGIPRSVLGFAAQFSILPYIKSVALTDRSRLFKRVPSHRSGLLENAIFGYAYFFPDSDSYRPQIPIHRRLSTVKFLLDQGLHQSRLQEWSSFFTRYVTRKASEFASNSSGMRVLFHSGNVFG